VDDVVQEVAIRALRAPTRFASEDHFARWCCRVAINLHIDTTRHQRLLSSQPPPEVASFHDTATAVERRMALQAVAAGLASLSSEERSLLFDAEPADSRREAVRLAVRRHRLRARLASLVEGLAAAIVAPARRIWRTLSSPTKASLAAAPAVVAGLVLGPLTTGAPSPPSAETARPVKSLPATLADAGAMASGGARSAAATAHAATTLPAITRAPWPAPASQASSRTLVDVAPGGTPVRVSREERPDEHQPVVCTGGHANVCVPRPPGFPDHTLPPLP
jgi:hypothetical protein